MAASASTIRWCSAFLSLLLFLSVCPSCQTHHPPSLWLCRTVKEEYEEVTYLPQCFQSLHTKLPSEKKSALFIQYAYLFSVLVKALNSFYGFYTLFWTFMDLAERLWISKGHHTTWSNVLLIRDIFFALVFSSSLFNHWSRQCHNVERWHLLLSVSP